MRIARLLAPVVLSGATVIGLAAPALADEGATAGRYKPGKELFDALDASAADDEPVAAVRVGKLLGVNY
jgi:hypothetical protein